MKRSSASCSFAQGLHHANPFATYFISHGGGPWPYMDDMRQVLHGQEVSLQDMPRQIGVTPKAVLDGLVAIFAYISR